MPNAVVEKVEPNAKKSEWRTVTAGGKQFIVFSAELADGLKVGTPLPEGTTEEPPKFDGALPSLRLPRPGGGGGTAFRNTKEGFLAEAEGRLRWQQVEEERRDRRTALMQARELFQSGTDFPKGGGITVTPTTWTGMADEMYRWLRQTSGAPSSASASLPVSSAGGAPESTSVGGAAQTRETGSPPKVPGGSSAPTDTFVPPSGPVTGEGAANPPGGTTGEGGQAPSPTTDESTPATADDLAAAAKHGLTPTKTKAIAASLGITVTKATELTREQLAAVINRYLEVKK